MLRFVIHFHYNFPRVLIAIIFVTYKKVYFTVISLFPFSYKCRYLLWKYLQLCPNPTGIRKQMERQIHTLIKYSIKSYMTYTHKVVEKTIHFNTRPL